ncbi:MAG TPA: MFS transporter [Solirubrobacterales bacterium]|nr:MFS transporter [Solirubrobacterales bacterium]
MTDLLLDPPRATAARARHTRLGLAAICLAFLMITTDTTIVNVALGPIVADLGGSLSGAQWIVSAYTIAFATFLLSAGALADRIGSKTALLAGLVVFGIGSAACAAAPSMGILVAARAVQGLGAAALMPCSLALITHTFPAGPQRRGALAAWGGISSIGLAAGPVLGGAIVDGVGWRLIFLVNLPIAALSLAGVLAYVTETRRHRHPLDLPGQALIIVALGGLSGGFILAGSLGWGAAATVGLLALGILAALGFWRVERLVALPMIPPELFRRRRFRAVVTVGGIYNFCFYGNLFVLSLFFHEELGLSPFDTGLALLPLTLAIGVIAFTSGRMIAYLGEWRAMISSLGAGAVGAALLAVFGGDSVALTIVFSLPFALVSLTMQAMTALAMEGVPVERIGLAAGVQNAARQAGGALGVALLGTLLAAGNGLSLHLPIGLIAALELVAVAITVAGRRGDRAPDCHRAGDETASRIAPEPQ